MSVTVMCIIKYLFLASVCQKLDLLQKNRGSATSATMDPVNELHLFQSPSSLIHGSRVYSGGTLRGIFSKFNSHVSMYLFVSFVLKR